MPYLKLICVFGILTMLPQISFKQTQRQFPRVERAYQNKEDIVRGYFREKGLQYEGFNLFIRAFKQEKKVEVWVKEHKKETYVLLHAYDFCTTSGTLGPKRKEGDLQIPEGIYHINHFNPQSNFLLSLGINYPNAADKILSDPKHPGGAIYIHGNCVTVGCIPITDDKIEELYILAVEARNNGQDKIPCHIFPAHLNATGFQQLKTTFGRTPSLIAFWENLKIIHDSFESNHIVPDTRVQPNGKYDLR